MTLTSLLRIFHYGERLNRQHSLVGDREFFEADQFAWIKSIEKQRDVVTKELQKVLYKLADLPRLNDISPDTYEHEVRNDTNQLRIVLFVDFKRPLPFWMHCINSIILEFIQRTPYVKNAAKKHKNWEHKFYGD